MREHRHEWEEIREDFVGVVVRCETCGFVCEHKDTDEGICLDCEYVLPQHDEREDRAYEAWRERDVA